MNFLLSLLTNLVPNALNYIKIGLFVLAVFFAGYLGYSYEHSKFVAYKIQIETIGKEQEAKNAQIIKEQQVTTERITNDYKNQLARIHNYYGGLHDSSSSSMSIPSNTLIRVNGFTTDPVFAEQCSNTTAQLVSLQEWVREQVGIK
jgi:hypothetical protein